MASKMYDIELKGYWREENKGGVPDESGVYCVYECTFDSQKEKVRIHKLIYIGEAENVRDRIANHEKLDDWKSHVRSGNELCYNFGGVASSDRERVEAAYIFHHEPPENDEYVESFPFDRTRVRSTGDTSKLDTDFTVDRT